MRPTARPTPRPRVAACALRFSNAYGPYSLHKKSVVAAWLRAALGGEPLDDPRRRRADPGLRLQRGPRRGGVATLDAPEDVVAGELFQVGTGRETTVNQLAAAIGAAVGRSLDIRHEAARAGDVRRNVSRVDKAADRLGYGATVTLDEGLAGTARWFSAALADPELAGVTPHVASGSE